jgi:hypothetical protein
MPNSSQKTLAPFGVLDTHYTHLTTKDINNALKKHPLVRKHTEPYEMIKSITEHIEAYGLYQDQRFDYVSIQEGISLFWKSIQAQTPDSTLDLGAVLLLLEKYLGVFNLQSDTRVDYARVQEGLHIVKEGLRLAI